MSSTNQVNNVADPLTKFNLPEGGADLGDENNFKFDKYSDDQLDNTADFLKGRGGDCGLTYDPRPKAQMVIHVPRGGQQSIKRRHGL